MKKKQTLLVITMVLILLLACQSTTQPSADDNSTSTQAQEVTVTPTEILSLAGTQESSNLSISENVDEFGVSMMFVPAGEFVMGSDDGKPRHQPAQQVYVDSFWIDKTEVTNKMYSLCVTAGKCQQPTNLSSSTHPDYYGNSEFDNYPVVYINWDMAETYCEWRSARLPTNTEWEKAARGTDERLYPWGNESANTSLLNYNSQFGDTTAVGSFPDGASVYGVLDLAGNVWELVNNGNGNIHGIRGGSWYMMNAVDSIQENIAYPNEEVQFDIGFRCVKGANQ